MKFCLWNASEACTRLQQAQDSASMVLSHTKPWQHITPALSHLQRLPVKSYMHCKILLLTDKSFPAFVSQ